MVRETAEAWTHAKARPTHLWAPKPSLSTNKTACSATKVRNHVIGVGGTLSLIYPLESRLRRQRVKAVYYARHIAGEIGCHNLRLSPPCCAVRIPPTLARNSLIRTNTPRLGGGNLGTRCCVDYSSQQAPQERFNINPTMKLDGEDRRTTRAAGALSIANSPTACNVVQIYGRCVPQAHSSVA